MKRAGIVPGKGNRTAVLSQAEENKIWDHLVYMSEIGDGASWNSVRLLLQEALISLKPVSLSRMSGYKNSGQMPNMSFVKRFAERHNLMLRKSSVISKARAVASPRDIKLWFSDIDSFIAQRPDIREAMTLLGFLIRMKQLMSLELVPSGFLYHEEVSMCTHNPVTIRNISL